MSRALALAAPRTSASNAPDFEALAGRQGWARLCPAIRRRFSDHDLRVTYEGDMDIRASFVGAIFAALLTPFGRPLPFVPAGTYPASVKVSPDTKTGGVIWRRDFMHPGSKAPIRVESVKQLGADGNLLECVRKGPLGGIGMGLRVYEQGSALNFASQHYFISWGRIKLPVPTWLTPGETLVEHIDEGAGNFRFRLTMTHPWFGVTVHQEGVFKDPHGGGA